MAVGLALTGRLDPSVGRLTLTAARDWLARAAVWFEAAGDAVLDTRLVRDVDDRPALRVACHPVCEDVEVRLSPAGKVKVTARTSPAGPGYHAHLCELLKQFAADFGFEWDEPPGDGDPGRYFVNGDRDRLDRHFLHWLAAACSAALREAPKDGRHLLGMPRQPKFRHPGPVLTPLGPRPVEWLKAVAADAAGGAAFFPWWNTELDAAFYQRRAECLLWLDFRHSPPRTDAEGELIDQIAADLANAFDLDPEAELPFAAWAEVLEALAADDGGFCVEPVSAELRDEVTRRAGGIDAVLGYRRHPVQVPLTGGWAVEVPGTFATDWADNHRTWTAWDEGRTVWFKDRTLGHPDGPVPSPAEAIAAGRRNLPSGEELPTRNGPVVGAAVFGPHTEDGRPMWRLCGVAAAGTRLAALNVYLTRATDRPFAERVWQSLTHHGPGERG